MQGPHSQKQGQQQWKSVPSEVCVCMQHIHLRGVSWFLLLTNKLHVHFSYIVIISLQKKYFLKYMIINPTFLYDTSSICLLHHLLLIIWDLIVLIGLVLFTYLHVHDIWSESSCVRCVFSWQLHECMNLLRQCPAHLTLTCCRDLIGFITLSLKAPVISDEKVSPTIHRQSSDT